MRHHYLKAAFSTSDIICDLALLRKALLLVFFLTKSPSH